MVGKKGPEGGRPFKLKEISDQKKKAPKKMHFFVNLTATRTKDTVLGVLLTLGACAAHQL